MLLNQNCMFLSCLSIKTILPVLSQSHYVFSHQECAKTTHRCLCIFVGSLQSTTSQRRRPAQEPNRHIVMDMPREVPLHGLVPGSSGQLTGLARSRVPLSPGDVLVAPSCFPFVPPFYMPRLPFCQTRWVCKLHWNGLRRQMDANEVLLWHLKSHLLCNMHTEFCLILFTAACFVLTAHAVRLISWTCTVTLSRTTMPFLP